jgi:hypothetical protein
MVTFPFLVIQEPVMDIQQQYVRASNTVILMNVSDEDE